jgi:putative FmdB family regulatory protein
MPIYAYRCQDCGFEKDQLQKLSDAPLTVCPSCSGNGFARKLTAPAFQLKGSGWYATDFRDGGQKKAGAEGAAEGGETVGDKASDKPAGADTGAASESAKSDSSPASTASEAAQASTPANSGAAAATASAGSSPAPKAASSTSPGASA